MFVQTCIKAHVLRQSFPSVYRWPRLCFSEQMCSTSEYSDYALGGHTRSQRCSKSRTAERCTLAWHRKARSRQLGGFIHPSATVTLKCATWNALLLAPSGIRERSPSGEQTTDT